MAGVIRMSKFGKMGRWGNQIFQYAFLKTYAKTYGLTAQVPPWVGEELYGLKDGRPEDGPPGLRVMDEKGEHEIDDTIFPHLPAGALVNTDIRGWFQYHTSYYRPHKEYIQSLFAEPVPEVKARLQPALNLLTDMAGSVESGKGTVLGFHFRRGDYGRSMFYITPVDWYVTWLNSNYDRLNRPPVFVATETLETLEELKSKFPYAVYHTCETLGIDLQARPLRNFNYLPLDKRTHDPRAMDFFPDWYVLQQACDVIVMPNSTFSFGAAWTSRRCVELWRSEPGLQRFEKIDPWDAYPAQFVKQKDYEHIEGLYLKENKYWKD